MSDWRCPEGHPITAANRHDMWCDQCGGDVIAIGAHTDPPEYQPDEDDTAAAYGAAMREGPS